MKPKNEVRKEALKPSFQATSCGLKPFAANRLRCDRRASARSDCMYHVAGTRLILQGPRNPRNSRGTKPPTGVPVKTRTASTRQGSPGERGAWSQRRQGARQSKGNSFICFAGLCGSAPLREVVGFPMRAKTKPRCLIPPQIGSGALTKLYISLVM